MRYILAPMLFFGFLSLCISMKRSRNLILALLCIGSIGLAGCESATQTAYQAESVGYVTLKGAADAYKAYKVNHTVSAADDAKAHQLFNEAKAAEITAIDISTGATNGIAGDTQALTALVTFLKQIGVNL